MDPETLGREYDKIADHWQEPFLQTNGLTQFEKAIRFTNHRGPALDIGCGSSGRFIDLLSKHGFTPEGPDVSRQMIALARQRHPQIHFYEADISKWIFPKKYDFISAWDSREIRFIHGDRGLLWRLRDPENAGTVTPVRLRVPSS